MGQPETDPRPRRRRFRPILSVRGLMVLVLIAGGGAGWLSWFEGRARNRRAAIVAVARSGGWAGYAERSAGGMPMPGGAPRPPGWSSLWLGSEYFEPIVAIRLGARATDADLATIGRLDALSSIYILDSPGVTDAGLAALRGLTGLKEATVERCKVTPAALATFRGMTALETLIFEPPADDDGLAHLAGLTRLTDLRLRGRGITDAGLAHLEGLRLIKYLELPDSGITDAGLAHLKNMRGLRGIELTRTRVATLEPLRTLPDVVSLGLGETDVDDRAMAMLAQTRSLTRLNLTGSRLTAAGFAALRGQGKLDELSLDWNPVAVTDETIEAIGDLPSIRFLQLYKTAVTDRSLATIAKWRSLIRLEVQGTKVTKAGVDQFRAMRPRADIRAD